jgi:hypothetical protein
VCNPPAWITQHFACLQKAEDDVRLLAEAREEEDAMEINISEMRSYYETLSKNASALFSQITQNHLFESALAEECFHEIVRGGQRFGNEIWTAISGLRNDAEGQENAHTERSNCIKDDLRLLKAGDDYWKNAIHSCAQGQDRRHEHLAVHVG